MIVFDLRCGQHHVFEAWFGSSEDFASQSARGLVSCPICDDRNIVKAVMAPAVAAKSNKTGDTKRKTDLAKLAAMQSEIESRCDYVGQSFASEARARHSSPQSGAPDADPPRGIIGETSIAEAMALIEDGIPVSPLPFRSRRTANA